MALNRAIAASCRENYAAYAGDSDASLQAVLAASRRSAPRQVRHVSHDDDAQLAAALQASLRETTPARPAMSEDEQLAAALQESLQVVTPPSSYAPSSSLGGGATLESTLAAFDLQRLVPVLAQEDIRDVETLALLEAEDLRAMGIPVGTRSKLARVIQTLQV
jgi:hypothetical protein